VEKSVRAKEGFFKKDLAEKLAVGSSLPFGRRTICADFAGLRDDMPERKGRMDG
jgi:hypothetical protein